MNQNLRNITNRFQDVQLLSLRTWPQANEFSPRDHGGPYVVLQEGYDPNDMRMIAGEFVLGRSGKWLALSHFYQLPVPERRAEFIFGTAAEVVQMMGNLPAKTEMMGHVETDPNAPVAPGEDEMAKALQAEKNKAPGSGT